jgi:Retrotransposon gag protein
MVRLYNQPLLGADDNSFVIHSPLHDSSPVTSSLPLPMMYTSASVDHHEDTETRLQQRARDAEAAEVLLRFQHQMANEDAAIRESNESPRRHERSPSSSRDDRERHYLALSRMSINDSALAPKPFKGTERDAERTEQWIEHFNTYVTFRAIDTEAALQLFRLLLVDDAQDWLRSLSPDATKDFPTILREFRRRYSLTEVDRWKKASSMWSRQQRSDESVDSYITDIRNAARVVPVNDDTLIRFAIIRGLRPEIRLHVLQSDASSLDAVIKASRVAEAALVATRPSNDVTEIKDQLAKLIERMDARPSIALINPSESVRRVGFASSTARRDDARGRSPSPLRRTAPGESDNQRPAGTNTYGSTQRSNGQNRRFWTRSATATRPPLDSRFHEHSQPRGDYHSQPFQPQQSQQYINRTSGRCNNCGRAHAFDRRSCPAFNLQCFQCGRTGHMARFCRSMGRASVPPLMSLH